MRIRILFKKQSVYFAALLTFTYSTILMTSQSGRAKFYELCIMNEEETQFHRFVLLIL